jgi:hypothetical protein
LQEDIVVVFREIPIPKLPDFKFSQVKQPFKAFQVIQSLGDVCANLLLASGVKSIQVMLVSCNVGIAIKADVREYIVIKEACLPPGRSWENLDFSHPGLFQSVVKDLIHEWLFYFVR